MKTSLKEKLASLFKGRAIGIPASILCVVLGVLLLIWPETINNILVYLIAGAITVGGVVCVVRYFSGSAYIGMKERLLLAGLTALAVGIVLFVRPDLPARLLPFAWGVLLVVGGFYKLQLAMDMRRMKSNRWVWTLCGSFLSIILGVLSVFYPFGIALQLFRFIGAAMIVEGVTDIVSDCWFNRARKTAYPDK